MGNSAKMNPQISTVEVGIKSLREVFIYPLSVSDQLNFTNVIVGIIEEVSSVEDSSSDSVVIKLVLDAIQINLAKILTFVLDEKENISFEELTNTQLMAIVDIIFETNYEGIIKNSRRLLEKARILWGSEQLSPKLSEKPVIN